MRLLSRPAVATKQSAFQDFFMYVDLHVDLHVDERLSKQILSPNWAMKRFSNLHVMLVQVCGESEFILSLQCSGNLL